MKEDGLARQNTSAHYNGDICLPSNPVVSFQHCLHICHAAADVQGIEAWLQ